MRFVPGEGYQAEQINTEENQISNAKQDDEDLVKILGFLGKPKALPYGKGIL